MNLHWEPWASHSSSTVVVVQRFHPAARSPNRGSVQPQNLQFGDMRIDQSTKTQANLYWAYIHVSDLDKHGWWMVVACQGQFSKRVAALTSVMGQWDTQCSTETMGMSLLPTKPVFGRQYP